jgi:hypothetical protein
MSLLEGQVDLPVVRQLRAAVQAKTGWAMDGDGIVTAGELCELLQVVSKGLQWL